MDMKNIIVEKDSVTITEKIENILSIGKTTGFKPNKEKEYGIAITIKPKAALELRNLLNNMDFSQIQ